MNRSLLALALIAGLAACSSPDQPPAATAEPAATPAAEPVATPAVAPLDAAIAGAWRTPEFAARDVWRHPRETLTFFGVTPDQHLIEITPGGGWYTEILAPLLREHGHYVGAMVDPASASSEGAQTYYAKQKADLEAKLAANAEVYGTPELRAFDVKVPVLGAPGSADTVLTFRNVHNWMIAGTAEAMFKSFFEVLKPGGTLGVVEHRAASAVPEGDRSGYVGQDQVIAMANAAGFVLEESSEINANPADTKDHEAGVWSLPPVLRLGEKDREKYLAIGESDRMTLRFRKPADAAPATE